MEIHGSFLTSESPRDQGSLPPLWGAQVETHGLCPRIRHLFWVSRPQGSVTWPLPSSPPDCPPLSTCHSHRCPGAHGVELEGPTASGFNSGLWIECTA